MKLNKLVEMMSDQRVALKSTMNKSTVGTTSYLVSEACHTYLRLIERDGNNKSAQNFVKDLVELK